MECLVQSYKKDVKYTTTRLIIRGSKKYNILNILFNVDIFNVTMYERKKKALIKRETVSAFDIILYLK